MIAPLSIIIPTLNAGNPLLRLLPQLFELTAGWANLRSRIFNLPYGDQGLLVPSALYHKSGGYDPIPARNLMTLTRYKLGSDPVNLAQGYDRPHHKSS